MYLNSFSSRRKKTIQAVRSQVVKVEPRKGRSAVACMVFGNRVRNVHGLLDTNGNPLGVIRTGTPSN